MTTNIRNETRRHAQAVLAEDLFLTDTGRFELEAGRPLPIRRPHAGPGLGCSRRCEPQLADGWCGERNAEELLERRGRDAADGSVTGLGHRVAAAGVA